MPQPAATPKTRNIPRSFGLQNPIRRAFVGISPTSDPMERWLAEDCITAPYHTIGYVAMTKDSEPGPVVSGKPASDSKATAGSGYGINADDYENEFSREVDKGSTTKKLSTAHFHLENQFETAEMLNKPTRQYRARRRTPFRIRSRPRRLREVAEGGHSTIEKQLHNVDDPPDSDGEDCEIHYYEERYDTRGERVCLRVGTKSAIEFEKRKSHRACLVRTRTYDHDRELLSTRLEIQSRYVHKALREVIGPHLRHNFKIPTITIFHPFEPLFHYRRELQEYANKSNDSKTRSHLGLFLQYVEHTLSREFALFDQIFANEFSSLEIDFENLWIAYKPGDLLYYKDGKSDIVFRLRSFEKEAKREQKWTVSAERIEYDGVDFGHVEGCTYIEPYNGRCSEADCMSHSGELAIASSMAPVRHRVMIDTVAYHNNVNTGVEALGNFNIDSQIFRTASEDHLQMDEEDLMICSSVVYGYDLALKTWGIFDVADIRDVKFNSDAFGHLLLSPDKKQLISSLVMQHNKESDTFDDYIQGKGKGLIFLLHGPPGVGKTFTAVLSLASSWDAVVLIDEADVFMQERDLLAFYRNELVSTLLQVLEYFEGIMFLTTNRVRTIDSAFQSRIHLSIAYPHLSYDARRELWKDWITRENSNSEPEWLTETVLDQLATRLLNGREIKNAMKMAHALAGGEKRRMISTDVFRGLDSSEEFKIDFERDVFRRNTGALGFPNPPQGIMNPLEMAMNPAQRIVDQPQKEDNGLLALLRSVVKFLVSGEM
ncbi:hypothetical protein O1611_g1941 [Lasiodiplodia mahajangana]|uniref:Uncharacterized protein n=1 Tax=Lasiodiplodia mahajangana TaxID=1108764 RepID=A0ACC2JW45_9PEZI|nr:hypothetical protein O1611_g1941 [Lasiodiplodia mahajangana]